jgi:hypothetical protein
MPRGHGEKYTRLREVAVVSLLAHPTITDAAAASGISEKALRLWMAKPDFAEAVRTLRRQVLEAGASRLTGLVSEAVETLREGLKARKSADRVRAARSILEFQQRFDKDRLLERVTSLEKQIEEMRRGPGVVITGERIGISVHPEAMRNYLKDIAKKPPSTSEIPKLNHPHVIDHHPEER